QSLLWWIGRVNLPARCLAWFVASRFQSLLWWIGRVNAGAPASPAVWSLMFQSLLWWIGRVNPRPARARGPFCPRFNPCSGESVASLAGLVGGLVACLAVSILVVVDRSRQPDANLMGGCGPLSVSILVVVDRSRQQLTYPLSLIGLRMFQSLLWWIGRVNI